MTRRRPCPHLIGSRVIATTHTGQKVPGVVEAIMSARKLVVVRLVDGTKRRFGYGEVKATGGP